MSPSRIVTIVALLALAPVVLFAPTLVASAVAAVVLGVAAVVDLRGLGGTAGSGGTPVLTSRPGSGGYGVDRPFVEPVPGQRRDERVDELAAQTVPLGGDHPRVGGTAGG